MEALFFALIAACGIMIALRAILFAIRLHRSDRPGRQAESEGQADVERSRQEPAPAALAHAIPVSVSDDGQSRSAALRTRLQGTAAALRRSLAGRWQLGLMGKMIAAFSAVIAFFGFSTSVSVYFLLTPSLERRVVERASLEAGHIADRAALVNEANPSRLRVLVDQYAARQAVAYVLVESRGRKALAHGFAVLPSRIERDLGRTVAAPDTSRVLILDERAVRELTVPVPDGQNGRVRLGFWQDMLEQEVSVAVTQLLRLVLAILCGGVVLTVYLAWRINRPISRLVKTARAISTGDIDAPALDVADPGEFGALSRSLERLRSSVNAAMNRLTPKP